MNVNQAANYTSKHSRSFRTSVQLLCCCHYHNIYSFMYPSTSPALIRSLFMYPHTYPCSIVFKSSSFQSANTHVNCQNCPTKTRKHKNPKSLGNMYRLESLPFHAGVVRYQALSGRYPRIPPVPVCELWQPCNLPSVYTRAEGRQWDKGT